MMMRGLFIAVLALLIPLGARAEGEPRLSVELAEGDIIVGQPLTLRMKLLVPSWMPKPPVWPTLEVPSLLVRLPERASTPVSETIDGDTWSGISRAYRLYPLEVGGYEIPGQSLIVTYADPGKPDPIQSEMALEPIRFEAVLPKGAEGLDPPIVANGLTLEQQIEGGPDLATGDAVTRIVTASIKGTTPILLPALLPDLTPVDGPDPAPLRAYPKEPVVAQSEQRGVLSGSRTETTTYVAQGGGSVKLAPIIVNWFNLDSGKVETAELVGATLSITAPPPPPPGLVDYARWGAMGLAILGGLWGIIRFVMPHLRRRGMQLRLRWHKSGPYARIRVRRAMRARDLNATMGALQHWSGFCPDPDPQARDRLCAAMAHVGAARYGPDEGGYADTGWSEAERTFGSLCRTSRNRSARETLPGLNPSSDQGLVG